MKENTRYKFVDWNGIPRGIKDVCDLNQAVLIAREFQCEIIDISKKQIVYSVWDGWDPDYKQLYLRMK